MENIIPTCPDCNAEITNAECLCGLPEEDPKLVEYTNHCWNCGDHIDSSACIESLTPGMGYHCNNCGKDLTEWKEKLCYLNQAVQSTKK